MKREISRRGLFGVVAGGALTWGVGAGGRAAAAPRHRLPDPGDVPESDPALLTAVEAAALLQAGRLHPRELLDACLSRTREFDGEIGAWVRLYPEKAYAAADVAGERLARARRDGTSVPLVCGLPVAVKDIYAVAGLPLTASSRVLEGNIASGDSGAWRRLEEAGAVLMGHAHTDEFAIGLATPQVGNPWNPEFSPGGSSGGSAAVLAARFAPLALGSDTGGSVRLPASACGVSSIKPTYGRITSYGMIPLTWTRDHVGMMGRSLADAALMMTVLAGSDATDPITALGPAVPEGGYALTAQGGAAPLAGRRIGVVSNVHPAPDGAIRRVMGAVEEVIRSLGATTVPVELPGMPDSLATGDLVEMGSYHQQFADRLGLYRAEHVPMVGGAVASLAVPVADYLMFERDRLRYQNDYNRMFVDHDLDAIMLPGTSVDGARRTDFLGVSVTEGVTGDVGWANYAGAPVVTLPAGYSDTTGLPVGVQIGARPWQDAELIALGLEIQEALPVWRDVPPLSPAPARIPEVAATTPGPGPDPTNTVGAMAPFRALPMSPVG
ncbi:amidase [Rhodococcus sp. Z13]|uniref:Amidase n=1 Tax=Rhodococcus sacchari TaxID=2962047 RepID=A0ACD4DLY5_9NOCA|nr:amidase [Rhodococcus sp. Z13]UYP21068.1 amidase [Rhodococcus sp. Z13]